MTASIAIRFIGYVIGGFLTFGAMFAAANTMYAAVASEGVKLVRCVPSGSAAMSILTSFLMESMFALSTRRHSWLFGDIAVQWFFGRYSQLGNF